MISLFEATWISRSYIAEYYRSKEVISISLFLDASVNLLSLPLEIFFLELITELLNYLVIGSSPS